MRIINKNYKGFVIAETQYGYLISRIGGKFSQHGHISKSKRYGSKNKGHEACLTVINCISKRKLTNNLYLRECQRRLLEPHEYSKLK